MTEADSSLSNMEGLVESMSSPLAALPLSCVQGHSIDPYYMFGTPEGQDNWTSYNVNGLSTSMPNVVENQQLATHGREYGQTQGMQLSSGQMKLSSMPNKRKASPELSPDAEGAQKMFLPNRRAVKASSVSLNATTGPMSNSPRSTPSGRKVVPLESVVNKSQSTATKKNVLLQESPRSQTGSHESVRAKLRESIASALALVLKSEECCSDGKMMMETESAVACEKGVGEKIADNKLGNDEEACSSTIPYLSGENNYVRYESQTKEMHEEVTQTWNCMGADFEANPVSSGEDASYSNGLVFKDEHFQVWVSDLNPHVPVVKQFENTDKPMLMHETVSGHEKEQIVQPPESLALKIESELYKLFGGVNKKYKEKGRSLMFNLKDRNNPDLREKVMSGEIPPDRLCSMTAEELASKELSQWRIAKAEELDQMKVLPDSDVNMRRLVKKTHKGEYQVDLDPDTGTHEEIPLGTSAPIQRRVKMDDVSSSPPLRVEKNRNDQDFKFSIPSYGADDVRDLPPIVSLDDFVELVDKEPLEKLPVNCERTNGLIKESLELDSESKSPARPSKLLMEMNSQKTVDLGLESIKPASGVKSSDIKVDTLIAVHRSKGEIVWEGILELNISSMANFIAEYKSGQKACTAEWPGSFEIKGRVKLDAFEKFVEALPSSRTRAIMVSHFVLKEPSSEYERNNLIEVVDSYNVDQRLGFAEPVPGVELYLCPPHSRTVEIIIDHLPRIYTEKLNDIDNGLIGIVVWRKVQITPSASSPNSATQYKNMSENPNFASRDQNAENYDNRNVGFSPRPAPHPPILDNPQPNDDDDDGDDAPPGFGPIGSRDEEDLPEFSFAGGSNPPISRLSGPNLIQGQGPDCHSRAPSGTGQVEQMRELIKKYGQNETKADSGITIEPWNDDDDDDIPEWQPQPRNPNSEPPPSQKQPQNQPLPQPQLWTPNYNQLPSNNPFLQPPRPNQNPVLPPHMPPLQCPPWPLLAQPLHPLQPPMNVHPQGTWWPYGPNNVGNQPSSEQLNGMSNLINSPSARDWRPNASNYRGY